MEHVKDWETIKKRYELLWQNEILDRCCVTVEAPKKAHDAYAGTPSIVGKAPKDPKELKKWWIDPEWMIKRNIEKVAKTHYAGEAVPTIFPYFGTGGHGKYLCHNEGIEYTPETIWIHPVMKNYESFDFNLELQNEFLQEELKTLAYLAKEGKDKFLIGFPDNTGSFDALSQLRGNVEIMMDLIDCPDNVLLATDKITDVLIQSGNLLFDALQEANDGGTTQGWMHVWCPEKHAQLQCDSSVMMSNPDFERFIMPELRKTTDWLEKSIYHFDGIEQIRHLDSLLSIDKINMIQWTQVDGQPPVTNYIPELKKIQQAGKGLVLMTRTDQIKTLLSELSPKGVILHVLDAKDAEEANEVVRFVEKSSYTKKNF